MEDTQRVYRKSYRTSKSNDIVLHLILLATIITFIIVSMSYGTGQVWQ